MAILKNGCNVTKSAHRQTDGRKRKRPTLFEKEAFAVYLELDEGIKKDYKEIKQALLHYFRINTKRRYINTKRR